MALAALAGLRAGESSTPRRACFGDASPLIALACALHTASVAAGSSRQLRGLRRPPQGTPGGSDRVLEPTSAAGTLTAAGSGR
jgi:hypothetical protein